MGSIDLNELLIERKKGITSIRKLNDLVLEYIKANKLIIFGGQAIDYALRLKGDALYPDYEIADYDFYSPNSVVDAYNIFRKMMDHKVEYLAVMPAYHPGTMRVRVNNLYFLADSGYIDKQIYKFVLDTALNYKGILFRHPFLQYSDQCRAFSYPFEVAGPKPTILHRFIKDKDRFLKLYSHYPINDKTIRNFAGLIGQSDLNKEGWKGNNLVKFDDNNVVYCGLEAYYVYQCLSLGADIKPVKIDGNEMVYSDKPAGRFKPVQGSMVSGLRKEVSGNRYYVLPQNQIGYHVVEIEGRKVKIASMQFVIICIYTLMLDDLKTGKDKSPYLFVYLDLLRIMETEWTKKEVNPIMLPSINMIGDKYPSALELYIEEHPEEEKEVKPPAFYYSPLVRKEEVLSEIPTEYEYHEAYGFK